MKVLLIKPPTAHFKNTTPPVSGMPLGLLYVAASLKKAGHEVGVYDAIVDAGEERWGWRDPEGLMRMGASWEEIRKVVEHRKPDVVGISSQYSSQSAYALKSAEAVKQANAGIKVIVGGPHASVQPGSFLFKGSPVDIVVIGEGELTMVEVLEALAGSGDLKAVNGIAESDDGIAVATPPRAPVEDVDQLPLPAYELVDMERYFYFNSQGKDGREAYRYPDSHRAVSVITSRGCPFNCIFCSIHLVMGRKFRAHSVETVMRHLRLLKERYDVRHVHFEDDNISFDMARFRRIVDGMAQASGRVTWDTPNGVRADFLDEAILRACKASGCTYLRIGVESADEEVSTKIIRKHLDTKKVIDIAGLCAAIGIDVEAFYIIGFPGEKIPQMKTTIRFALSQARRHGLYPYDMFTATPLIGTELHRLAKEKGYLSKDLSSGNLAVATQGEGMITTGDFSPADLKRLLRGFRMRRHIATAVSFLRFLVSHPKYIVRALRDRPSELNQLVSLIRYKNCVMRRIGAA